MKLPSIREDNLSQTLKMLKRLGKFIWIALVVNLLLIVVLAFRNLKSDDGSESVAPQATAAATSHRRDAVSH